MPRGKHHCVNCGVLIGNRSLRCRHCGHGEARPHASGYRRVYAPGHDLAGKDGYVLEHRWMLHEMAVPIPEGHHVHHRNGDKADNRWSNLEVIPASDHHRLHIAEAGEVTNQHGVFPVISDPDERRAATNAWRRAWRAKRADRSPWHGGRWSC